MKKGCAFRVSLVVSEVFAAWYISAAYLLYQTNLETTLTGGVKTLFTLYTRFFTDVNFSDAAMVVWLPIAVGVLAVLAAVFAHSCKTGERLAYVLPPLLAAVFGVVKIWTFLPAENATTEACAFGTVDNMFFYAVWIVCMAVLQMRGTDE